MKVFEYLACSRVILTSDLPVLQEVLSPENSIILPQDDIKAWVQSLRRIQSDPALSIRLANQAAELAKKYSWQNRSVQILQATPKT
jgi:glycosyltransferase involved in cell wall biosynthesis